ncbi:hypothetical protein GXN76_08050 [Kroppenstedtia pulmonis]|uniref:Glycerophosphoryl diester phosphodiesterase membrane domain-containing protein n=1 Tax=Kroppenstedtia pulmonis TaxID=1380685 RepID=A0A7D4C6H3_9BACL|nr:hypothetical protein [Kroppenstedtia pulmonis]QKG84436.1 hypothetical protein GXN76_08050 [Kroppenstedtia pulmonis]
MTELKYEIRPQKFPSLLDGTFRILRSRFLVFLLMSLVFMGISRFLLDLTTRLTSSTALSMQGNITSDLLEGIMLIISLLVVTLTYYLLSPPFMAAVSGITMNHLKGKATSFRDALKIAGKTAVPVIVTQFLVGLLISLSFILPALIFFIPGLTIGITGDSGWIIVLFFIFIFFCLTALFLFLFISVRFYLVVPVIIQEGIGYVDALKRSWHLTRSFFWRILGLWFMTGLLTYSYQFVINVSSQLSIATDFPIAVNGLVSLVFTPLYVIPESLIPILSTLIYVDSRCRKEGWDLESKMDHWEEARNKASAERWS